MRKPCITPISWINDLQVVIDDLEEHLSTAKDRLTVFMASHTECASHPDLANFLEAEAIHVKEQEVEQQE